MLYPNFLELMEIRRKALQSLGESGRNVVSAAVGDYTSLSRGQGLEFSEVRRYVPGDDIRNIDWRVTARTGVPHLKVFMQERERTVLLCVDASSALKFGTRGTFKSIQVARAAAMLGWCANGANDRVGAIVFGDVPDGLQFFRPTRSRRSFWRVLKLLSSQDQATLHTDISLANALQSLDRSAPTGALVFIISGFDMVTDKLKKSITHLHRRCDVVFVRVNDPADQVISPLGVMRFVGSDGSKLCVDTDSQTGRESYKRQWQENRQALQDIVLHYNLSIIDLHTDRDVYTDLSSGLHALGLKWGMR